MSQTTIESAFGAHSIAFLEELYEAFLENPSSVPSDWQAYFASLGTPPQGVRVGPSFTPRSLFNPGGGFNGENGHARSGNGSSMLRAAAAPVLQPRASAIASASRAPCSASAAASSGRLEPAVDKIMPPAEDRAGHCLPKLAVSLVKS